MRRWVVLIIVMAVAAAAVALYPHGEDSVVSGPSPREVQEQVLARLGGMDCYTYTQNVTVSEGNSTLNSRIDGGLSDGVYFFHGRRENVEWWGTINGTHLVEKVSISGKVRRIDTNLTKKAVSQFLLYDPVRLAIRALGSTDDVSLGRSTISARFSLPVEQEGRDALLSGTIKVRFDEDYRPVEVHLDGVIKFRNGEKQGVEFSAVLGKCAVPKWIKDLPG